MKISSSFEYEVARPLTYETGTLKYPLCSEILSVIVKIAKSAALSLLLIRMCPLIGLVESSIVLKKA